MSLQREARARIANAIFAASDGDAVSPVMAALSDDAVVAWVLSQTCEPRRMQAERDYVWLPRSAGVAARLAEADRG